MLDYYTVPINCLCFCRFFCPHNVSLFTDRSSWCFDEFLLVQLKKIYLSIYLEKLIVAVTKIKHLITAVEHGGGVLMVWACFLHPVIKSAPLYCNTLESNSFSIYIFFWKWHDGICFVFLNLKEQDKSLLEERKPFFHHPPSDYDSYLLNDWTSALFFPFNYCKPKCLGCRVTDQVQD